VRNEDEGLTVNFENCDRLACFISQQKVKDGAL